MQGEKLSKEEIASRLEEIGELLNIKGESPFKVRAYQKAADSIRRLDKDIYLIAKDNRLDKISGVGTSIAEKLKELITTGKLTYLEELYSEIPSELIELLQIPGLGPRKAHQIYFELNITGIDELKKAIDGHKLRQLDGFGPKSEEKLKDGIEQYKKFHQRLLLSEAYPLAQQVVDYLKESSQIENIEMSGSLRRMKETIGDIDILVSSKEPEGAIDFFTNIPLASKVLLRGPTKCSILTNKGLQVDLRVVAPSQFGAALQYFTGSKEHNTKIRGIVKRKGWKLNEYGLFDAKTDKLLEGEDEAKIYEKIGMALMPPEIREDRGEIELALKNKVPELIEQKDIRGDLHIHSTFSDGYSTLEENVEKARDLGYEYIAFSDHAEKLKVAGGLTVKQFESLIGKIRDLNDSSSGIRILSGVELNIDNDGNVDFDEDFLARFDVVTASIHSGFNQSREQLTERALTVLNNPYVDILGHPSGRIIMRRPPFKIDMIKVIDEAAKNNKVLELNSYPDRLDLNDEHLKEAKIKGVKIAICTDAHLADHMDYIFYGIAQARRGWLSKEDVINTFSLKKLLSYLKKDNN